MKRGKDDDKIVEPLFPRLHVKDTEKGGLRAPPRNKMALYEQLSVPSHRFNPGILPLKPNSNNHIPPPSSSQVSGSDRSGFFPLRLPPTPAFHPEKSYYKSESGRVNAITSLPHIDRRVVGAEDDYAVPTFLHSKVGFSKASSNNKKGQNFMPPSDPKHGVLDTASASNIQEKTIVVVDESKNHKGENVYRDYRVEESLRVDNEMVVPRSFPTGEVQSDDGSDASIVDSVLAMDISPDDVVALIGPKRFWKARRMIINQQRIFSIQVFELHRLIKVQKLIAESPHLLLEDASTLSKPPLKTSPAEKECCIAKRPSQIVAPKQPVECSAESVVGKSLPSTDKSTPPGPSPDTWIGGSWGGQSQTQPPAGHHQWLVPVMSPTEGLIYKPYGFGPYGSGPSPGMGNFMNPAYGVATQSHHSVVPGIPPAAAHSYFPIYGMPMVRVPGRASEQTGCFLEPVCCVQTGLGESKNPIPRASSAPAPSEIQRNHSGGFNLFPSGESDTDQPNRVIKAVPHNPRSASESVARIFRSIQEERRQYDSM